PIGSSTSGANSLTLFLKTFRGVRAISEFDWPFTPTHRSSGNFSTLIGSALHPVLPVLQPVHRYVTQSLVCPPRLDALFGLAVAPDPALNALPSPVRSNS